MSVWKELKYFTPKENWGSASKMKARFLRKLDATRNFVNYPFVITCGTQGVHSKKSQHYEGLAADLIILNSPHVHVVDVLIGLERFDWGGIGYYPHWKHNDKVVGGWHLDDRELEPYSPQARWMGVLDEKGKQIYVSLNYQNLVKYGVIETS